MFVFLLTKERKTIYVNASPFMLTKLMRITVFIGSKFKWIERKKI